MSQELRILTDMKQARQRAVHYKIRQKVRYKVAGHSRLFT
jgi:hypothetical protein